jgi:glycosyltransferase involved in cell wall biosynthesis
LHVGLNLLFVAPGLAGGRVYGEGLLKGLAAVPSPYRFTVYTRRGTALPPLPADRFRHVEAPVAPHSTLGRTWWEYARLPAAVRRDGCDLFHGLGSLSPWSRGRPLVLTVHDLIYRHYPQTVPLGHRLFMETVLPRVARRAARVIVPSQATAADAVNVLGVAAARIRVVPYGGGQDFRRLTDPAAGAPVLARLGVRQPYVISVCRTYPHKNLAGLLRAFAVLRAGRKDVQLVLVGERYRTGAELNRLTAELGLAEAVRFTGFVSHAELNALYSAAAAFAFPSLVEGLGLPVLEALACGAPVVASSLSAVPEAVGDAGLTADPRDPNAFAAALERVLGDEALAADLRVRGPVRAAGFTWERCAAATLAVYEEVG